jgi:hypothetical protein
MRGGSGDPPRTWLRLVVKQPLSVLVAAALLAAAMAMPGALAWAEAPPLEKGFADPPDSARPWVYWWWLNGYVTREGVVRDLDEMHKQGIGGVLVFQADGGPTPGRTEFMSPSWRELFGFAVEEAARRNIEVGLNLCDGWNAGGPWVKSEDAAKSLVHFAMRTSGPKRFTEAVASPAVKDPTYRDVAVFAWRLGGPGAGEAKDDCLSRTWVDLTAKMAPDGRLAWDVPDGQWLVVRFGYRIEPKAHTKCTGGKSWPEIDPLSTEAMDRHFAATAGVLLQDLKAYAGKTWNFVHIDSGEIGSPNWTPKFREDFRRLRGYDPLPYIAAKAGEIVDDAATTERFLEDYERTIGDLMIECYYGRLGELARKHGLGTHSEAAGYQKPCVDALRSMGCNDLAMSEFWSRRSSADPYIHQLAAGQLRYHDGIKNASSAAHIYGRKIVQAEAFTVTGYANFTRDLFDLKDIGDHAFCQGLNRMVFHHFFHQPESDDRAPGYVWPNVGVEINRKATWWPLSRAWLDYLGRCQHLFQEGRFVADFCYFQGEWVPAFVPAKWAMNPALPPGYDCDTINAEALATRAAAGPDGRLVLPDGQSYRYLALWQGGRWQRPPKEIFMLASKYPAPAVRAVSDGGKPLALSPATLRTLKGLVEGGLTLIGPRPARAIGLAGYPASDADVKKLADDLWGVTSAPAGERRVRKGRVIWGRPLAEVARADGLRSDLEIHEDPATAALPAGTLSGIPSPGTFDWIHRSIGVAEVYFIANLRNVAAKGEFIFRVDARQPELWDPLTGVARDLPDFREEHGGTRVPLEFAPRQSWFVVFRRAAGEPKEKRSNFPVLAAAGELVGPWTVKFDPKWGGPESVVFEKLEDWTKRHEPGIKYYSGRATYEKTFDLPEAARQPGKRLYLDLGNLKNLAAVRLNGADLGVLWTAPWRVEITGPAKPAGNVLEIDVANLWSNRLVGDAALPPQKRLTLTNAVVKPDRPLLESGLLGPVTLHAAETVVVRP